MIENATSHAATTAILAWLRDARVPVAPLDPAGGSIRLDFGRAYRVTVLVFLVIATVFLVGSAVVFQGELVALVMVLGIFGAIWLAMLYGAYDAFLVRLRASPRGLESRSPLTGLRSLPWECVQAVSYSSTGNWYAFRSDRGWAIRVSIYRNGLRSFSALVSKHIGKSPARRTPPRFHEHTY